MRPDDSLRKISTLGTGKRTVSLKCQRRNPSCSSTHCGTAVSSFVHGLEEVAATLVAVSLGAVSSPFFNALVLALGGTKDRLAGIKGFRGGRCILLVSGSKSFCHSCSMPTGIGSLQ